jgi:hypothetical protein
MMSDIVERDVRNRLVYLLSLLLTLDLLQVRTATDAMLTFSAAKGFSQHRG